MKYKNYIIFAVIFIVCLIVDILTKHFLMCEDRTLINGVLSFYPTYNRGAGWSFLSDHTLFLTIFSAVIVVSLIFVMIFFKSNSKVFHISMALIFAGAIGNLIDRIFLGEVRDFIKLDFIHFPIFNFADCCLTVGAILICVFFLFIYKDKKK